MTEPKKVEETKDAKKPETASTDAPKKDEAPAKATSNTTPETQKSAEPVKNSDGGANIQTKHTEIAGSKPTIDSKAAANIEATKLPDPEGDKALAEAKKAVEASEEEAAKVREHAANYVHVDPEDDPDYTPPETMSDDDLKATIGEVAFQTDANQTETKLAPVVPVKGSAAAAAPSIKRLKSIVYAYPKDAKDGTVIFGYGGISITLGDLRAVVSVL